MYTIKQGDTRQALKTTLLKTDGTPLDLTGLEVHYNFKDSIGRSYRRVAEIFNETEGICLLVFEIGDTDTEGLLKVEIEVTHEDGRKESFPSDGYITINVLPNLKGV